MKSLTTLLGLLLLTAAAEAGINWGDWHDENTGQPFRWRSGREDITTDQRLYRPARPGLEIFGPTDTHLTYSFNSYLYCDVANKLSPKTMIIQVTLLDITNGGKAVVYAWPKEELAPGEGRIFKEEVNPDPRFKYWWDLTVDW